MTLEVENEWKKLDKYQENKYKSYGKVRKKE